MAESVTPIDEAPEALVRAGRDALARHAWPEAYELLARADREGTLAGTDLEALGEAAFFAAKADARVDAKERAAKAHQAEGDPVRAAYLALDVANEHLLRTRASIASGWVRRAERLLEGLPESYAHGYLALIRSVIARTGGDIPAAVALATEASGIAMRSGHADLKAAALTELAMLKIATGGTAEGLALLEEAAIDAVNGELSPILAGITACQMISVCRDLTDYQRASEWLEATDRWCERQEVSGFPGICRVHRAEIVALQGGWERAEQELRQATRELAAFDAIPPMADGLYAMAEIRRLKGDLAGAEAALREAHALGRTPQPALALIRMSEGKLASAMAAIDLALSETSWDQWARARLLAAQVEVGLAAGDVARARAASDELGQIVETYPVPAFQAGTHQARGRVLLAEGDGSAAVRELGAAVRLWRQVGARYEVARTRAVLSKALRAVGGEDDADLELRAARDEFERLGAAPDLLAAERELSEIADRRGRPIQVRMAFMFTDIVGSTNLAEALGNEAWARLLRWHDETLRDLCVRGGGSIVNSTGDGFFMAFPSSSEAVACGIAIQRALADQRRESSFVPPVRIGIHAAEASQRGSDYSGLGVNVAARVAALAAGDEILVSDDALREAGDVATSSAREVRVRGVAAPLRVASVAWQ